jgi:hypothetical protein
MYPDSGIIELKAAANQFVDMMYPDDQGEVINFSSEVYVSQSFTNDKALLHAAIDIDIENMTALIDAVWQSIYDAGQQTGRKAALIMTDGNENQSHLHSMADVADLALTAGVPCYIIGLGDVNTYILGALATATGGTAWFTPDPDELENIYKKIGVGLATQLRITYVSCDPFDYEPDKTRHVFVYLTNYPPLTDNGDILAFEDTYEH